MVNFNEPDQLLFEIAAQRPSDAPSDECIDDGLLARYPKGTLSEAQLSEVEGHLARCAECRALLAELSEPLPQATRDAAIAAMTTAAPATAPRRAWTRRVFAFGTAAAAIAAVALLTTRGGAPLPAYDIEGPSGLVRQVRGGDVPAADEPAIALPSSQLEFWVRPAIENPQPLPNVALFASGLDGRLQRVATADIKEVNGTFRVRATGAQLFGQTPGTRTIVLVAASSIETIETLSGMDASALPPLSNARWTRHTIEYQHDPE